MKGYISRSFIIQIHTIINILCIFITLIGKLFLQMNYGLFTTLALVIPFLGIIAFLLCSSKNGKRNLYLWGSLSSCISLLLVSQNLFKTSVRFKLGFWGGFYFLLTTVITLGIIYLLLFDKNYGFLRKATLGTYLKFGFTVISGSVIIYRTIFARFLPGNNLMFISYSLWGFNLIWIMITCIDLRRFLLKR